MLTKIPRIEEIMKILHEADNPLSLMEEGDAHYLRNLGDADKITCSWQNIQSGNESRHILQPVVLNPQDGILPENYVSLRQSLQAFHFQCLPSTVKSPEGKLALSRKHIHHVIVPILSRDNAALKPHILYIQLNNHLLYNHSFLLSPDEKFSISSWFMRKGFEKQLHRELEFLYPSYSASAHFYDYVKMNQSKPSLNNEINTLLRATENKYLYHPNISNETTHTLGNAKQSENSQSILLEDKSFEGYLETDFINVSPHLPNQFSSAKWVKKYQRDNYLDRLSNNPIVETILTLLYGIYDLNLKFFSAYNSPTTINRSRISKLRYLFLAVGLCIGLLAATGTVIGLISAIKAMSIYLVLSQIFVLATVSFATILTCLGLSNFLYYQTMRLYYYITTGASELYEDRHLTPLEEQRIMSAFQQELKQSGEYLLQSEILLKALRNIVHYCNYKIDKNHLLGCPIPWKYHLIEKYRQQRKKIRCQFKSTKQLKEDVLSILSVYREKMALKEVQLVEQEDYLTSFLGYNQCDLNDTHQILNDLFKLNTTQLSDQSEIYTMEVPTGDEIREDNSKSTHDKATYNTVFMELSENVFKKMAAFHKKVQQEVIQTYKYSLLNEKEIPAKKHKTTNDYLHYSCTLWVQKMRAKYTINEFALINNIHNVLIKKTK